MHKSTLIRMLSGLILVCTTFSPARAQLYESWVSGTGSDGNDCTRLTPCATLDHAIGQTLAGGQVNVTDAGRFGSVVISKAITIVNDTSGTASLCCGDRESGANIALFIVAAGPTDVVTLRGLTLHRQPGFSGEAGVLINNALQVNIEKCTIRNEVQPAILVAPFTLGPPLASSINLKIEDTVVTGSAAGVKLTSVPGLPVNATIFRSSFQNNLGAGIRVDGTGGGPIKVAIAESNISLNSSNGVLALSGPSGNVAVNVTHSFIASNALYGVQSNQTNGGLATVIVESSKLTNNVVGQVGFFGGGGLLTAGNNLLFGANGTGFSGPIALQ